MLTKSVTFFRTFLEKGCTRIGHFWGSRIARESRGRIGAVRLSSAPAEGAADPVVLELRPRRDPLAAAAVALAWLSISVLGLSEFAAFC